MSCIKHALSFLFSTGTDPKSEHYSIKKIIRIRIRIKGFYDYILVSHNLFKKKTTQIKVIYAPKK